MERRELEAGSVHLTALYESVRFREKCLLLPLFPVQVEQRYMKASKQCREMRGEL